MNIDLRKIPFSRFGSYSAINLGKMNESINDNTLYFRDVGAGDNNPGYIFKIIINTKNDYLITSTETYIKVKENNSDKFLIICFPDENRVRFKSNGLSFSFSFILNSYDHINSLSKNKWELHNYSNEMKLGISLLSGECISDIVWDMIQSTKGNLKFSGSLIDIDVERYQCVPKNKEVTLSFEAELNLAKEHYRTFYKKGPKLKDPSLKQGYDMAMYILYSLAVHPLGLLTKYAIYMSKNWMTNIWSWDNLFTALGLSTWNEELALDQVIIFNDVQDKSGVLPDTMNNLYCSFSCCKPPIEGWAFLKLIEFNDFFKKKENLRQVYKQLIGLEKYWSEYRVNKDFPLPYYNHGNDSGWDNATPFALGVPVTTPDLPTYLVLLYEALTKISNLLGLKDAELTFKRKGDLMLSTLIEKLWDNNQFRSYNHISKSFTSIGNSLIEFMPLLICDKLPKNISDKLINQFLNGNFIGEHGIATEALTSPYYEKEGYWRGPFWAPTSLLFIDALKQIGKTKLSKQLALSYCKNAQKYGMCENFDPITGEGFDDPAFAWTSSVFLLLSEKYI
ncbi:MAG: MGH1-like glycoside hydrolase domain-containing protein [Pleomorphochaeta sp.]